ncbi:MAG: hypothetical protein Q9223_001489 [Gallowayella weberi]
MSGPDSHAQDLEAALMRKCYDRQGGAEDVALAREYLSAMHALDTSEEDDTTILKRASLLCINSRRQESNIPQLTGTELDEQIERMVVQVLDSVRNSDSTTALEEIMERFNDEMIGVTSAEREEFLVLDGWKVRERKTELREWPEWVMDAFDSGDLRSDFWGTEVRRDRKDLIEFLLEEMDDEEMGECLGVIWEEQSIGSFE